jgi:molybdopterin/thiamine biosynthesis adenylyltransferase
MTAILVLAAVLWGIGWAFKVPLRVRLTTLAALWLGALAVTLILAPDNPLRVIAGGDPRPWAVLGGLAALIAGYRWGLDWLRARARPLPMVAQQGPFSASELDRYSRQILLHDIGGPGQARMKAARVLVVGAGGLGAPALMYLAGAGVGTIGVIDPDTVDASNLHRQIIHTDAAIGTPKALSAADRMVALNPFVTVRPYVRRLDAETAPALLADYDLILDGTDNFDTRYLVNRVAASLGKPLIAAALTQWEGQIALFDPARGGPCYECVFHTRPAPGLVPACAEAGVAGPLPGILGAMMAMEAVKHLTGAGTGLRGVLVIHDALHAETRRIGTHARAGCPACGGKGLEAGAA